MYTPRVTHEALMRLYGRQQIAAGGTDGAIHFKGSQNSQNGCGLENKSGSDDEENTNSSSDEEEEEDVISRVSLGLDSVSRHLGISENFAWGGPPTPTPTNVN